MDILHLTPDYRDLFVRRDARVAELAQKFAIADTLRAHGIDDSCTTGVAEAYADSHHVLVENHLPAWQGLVHTLSMRRPSLLVDKWHEMYDRETGTRVVSRRHTAELLWGFSSVSIEGRQPTRRHLYAGLHILIDADESGYDAITAMPQKRPRQVARQMTAFQDWFCTHTNIIETDLRTRPFDDPAPLDQKSPRTTSFFNAITPRDLSFADPTQLDSRLAALTKYTDETDATVRLEMALRQHQRSNIDFLHAQARTMLATAALIDTATDVVVPDTGDVHFMNFKSEWHKIAA